MQTKKIQLRQFCMVRSGDKGNTVDISLFAPTREIYDLLKKQVSAERVGEFYACMASGPTTRYEVANVLALKYVVEGALGGGAAGSLRSDNLGKAYGANLLRLEVDIDPALLKGVPNLCHPDSAAALAA